MNGAELVLRRGVEAAGSNAIALTGRGFSVSYGALERQVRATGLALRELGVVQGDFVLISHSDGPEFITYVLAAIAIGAVAAPVNPRLPNDDFVRIVRGSGARFCIFDQASQELRRPALAQLAQDMVLIASGFAAPGHQGLSVRQDRAGDFGYADCTPEMPALCLHTSGTTGLPKGVVHAHRNILEHWYYLEEMLGVRAGERVFMTSKMFFAYSLGISVFGALSLGATAVVTPLWPAPMDVLEMIEDFMPDYVFSVPKVYQLLLDHGLENAAEVRRVKAYVSAGERLPVKIAERWQAATGVRVFDGYGASETVCMIVASHAGAYRPGSAGQACGNAEIKLRPHGGAAEAVEIATAEVAEEGVLWVRSRFNFIRYTDKEAEHRHQLEDNWVCTGDLFVRDTDGFYYHVGREDDMIKRSSRWVAPSEVENSVTHDGVREVALIGRPDDSGLTELVLFLVKARADADEARIAAEVMEDLRGKLSKHKLPDRVTFVAELPRGATGKLQRYRLRA